MADPALLGQRTACTESIAQTCDPAAIIGDLPAEATTPESEHHADDHQEDGFEGTSDEILLPAPDFKDKHVDVNTLLPQGIWMARGTVRKARVTEKKILLAGPTQIPF